MTGMKRIEAGLIRKAMAEPWEKLSFALTLNLLALTISFFSGTLWLLFFASLIFDVLAWTCWFSGTGPGILSGISI